MAGTLRGARRARSRGRGGALRPLYQYAYGEGLGTLYTADYRPAEGRVTYHWPECGWEQSFGDFAPGVRAMSIGRPG